MLNIKAEDACRDLIIFLTAARISSASIRMGNTVRRARDYLRDPYLVRKIQERLGVKQVQASRERCQDVKDPLSENGIVLIPKASFKWLANKTRKRVKCPNSSPFAASPSSSPESEKSVHFPDIIVETLPVLNIFFRLATELGYEPFYITFFPFLTWNVDTSMARHIVVVWCCSMYLGQASKALFKWKRPSSPPAIRLENNPNLETEYGFPSTHAIVSTTVPFYIMYFLFHRYDVSPVIITIVLMLVLCFAVVTTVDWTTSCIILVWVCVSQ